MTVAELVQKLRDSGAQLRVDGDQLRISAPVGVVTPEIQSWIRANKQELLDWLRNEHVAPATDETPVVLAPPQEGLWIFQELQPNATTYNHTPVIRIDGPLNADRLIAAIVHVVERHEPLCSVIDDESGVPVLRRVAIGDGIVTTVDLGNADRTQHESLVQEHVHRTQSRPFDLRREIPFRAVLVRLNPESHVLITTFHHIAGDGMSLRNFYRELACSYAGDEPAPLRARYSDYARSETRFWTPERIEERLAFWKNELEDAPTVLEIPTDRPRRGDASYVGGIVSAPLDAATSAALRDIMKAEGASLFMTVLAAYTAALHRHTGQRDLVIGTPLHGRYKPEYADLIGMFVNQMPLRVRVDSNATFRDLIRQARSSVLRTLTDREMPFARLVQGLGIPRDQSRSPLFQVVLNVVPALDVASGLRAGDVTFRLPDVQDLLLLFDGESKFDLTLYPTERDGEINLILVYNADLFSAARMREILGSVKEVLSIGGSHPDRLLHDGWLKALPANDGGIAGPDPDTPEESVAARFTRIASAYPDRPALIENDGEITYASLHAEAQRIAHIVAASTADVSRPVGVLVPHEPVLAPAILGVLLAGRPYVPLDASYPAERLAYMVADSDTDVILTTTGLREQARSIAGPGVAVVTVDDAVDSAPALPMIDPQTTAYLLYTSGSTGRPKAVVQSQGNLVRQADRYARALRIGETDRLALLASISFDACLMDLFGGLLNGAAVCPIDARSTDLSRLPELLEKQRLTIMHVTPTLFRALRQTVREPRFPTIRAVDLGGEAMRPDDIAFFDEHFRDDAILVNSYGPSEHTFALGFIVPRDLRSNEIPIGWPIGDVEVLLLDKDGREDPVSGVLALRSRYGALGYWNNPDASAAAFLPDPLHPGRTIYRTGDVVRRRSDGSYVFLHREDHQLKIRGHRVEPTEVESVLREHPAVAAIAVHAPAGPDGTAVLTACVVLKDSTGSIADVANFARDRLLTYMVPTAWATLDRLPLTPSGKVDRRALPSGTAQGTSHEIIEARSAEEQEISQIWAEILGTSRFGVYDDFFELGGHSLMATQVVTRIRETLEIDLPLRHFFEHPTVAATAQWVHENRAAAIAVPPLEPQELPAAIPLSFSQERMWLIQNLTPGSVAYNMAGAVRVRGALDVERLRRAIVSVTARQDSLRTRFLSHSGVPSQDAFGEGCDFEFIEAQGATVDERIAYAEARAVDKLEAPYNLETGPLCRVLVVRIDENQHVVAVGMHHIISDLWSFAVFGREIAAAYEHPDTPRPPLPVRYADYAVWQRKWLGGEALRQQLDHWRVKLDGVAALELPIDFPRPAFFSFDGAVVKRDLSPSLRSRLEAVSAQNKATPFMTALAAFNALLSTHSNQTDIAVGVPIANRTQTVVEDLIGTFVNTLVHRNDTSGDPTFRELLQRVRATALDAFSHQDVQFDLLVKELQPARDPSRPPLFQVLFNVGNANMKGGEISGLETTALDLPRRTAQLELTVNVMLNELQSTVLMSYNTALFTRDTAERLLAHYVAMLERVVENPDIRLSELQRVTEADRRTLLETWNETARDYPDTARLTSLFAAQAKRTPDAVAVESPTGSFTYTELLEYAQQVTAALQQMGVKPGDRVAILMQRSREMLGALLGILGTGASYVPVDPNYPDARVRYMLEDSGAVVVVTHRNLHLEYQIDVPLLDLDRWTPPAPVPFVDVAREQAAYVIYTSGSTGKPKGVEVPHGAVANFLLSMQARPGLRADDALLAVTTISFDIAVLELYLPLITGARVVIASENEALDAHRLIERMQSSGITVMQATPATWKLLLAADWEGKPDLRVLCGGEALPRSLADALLDRVAELWNMYGPTETTVWSTIERIERDGPILIGRPIANTTLYVLREDLEPVPIGVQGELYIGGAGVANGYVNRPDLTAERFIPNPFRPGERMYRTGDLVRYRADGRVEHLGRLDHQVKVRGFRIELGEIESALRSHQGISDAAVAAFDDRLVAYIVGHDGRLPPAGELRRTLSTQLPQYMMPSMFIPLDALPLTPNGKVDRKKLPAPEPEVRTVKRVLPSRPNERFIAEIWASLLGINEVGVSDNFFEVGGHSLLAMQVVAQIEQRSGVRIEPRLLFFRTLGELAELIPEQVTA